MSSQVSEIPRQGLNARQAETVDRLLTAGLAELRVTGHEALTIRNVAQRAGVSPATAYTYLASKNHLFAELFSRKLAARPSTAAAADATVTARVQHAVRELTEQITDEPALAAAVTPALLSTDPDVDRLRLKIGAELLGRIRAALATDDHEPDPAVLETLLLAFSGGLLQAGMGLMTYDEMASRLEASIAVILRGNS
ncbi:TetR/AcrR family transcriptional regulator [Nocardioides sp. Kera G14]|uniref:TetR/AcrR family transcriptional regulator n=1 Tax=Nocardioides sp. Kera G14 TaxID=2884264 RepID=UPI001D12DA82|nr:TetR/AcrR family transcriptional regulator [Nocardioides sp. Kera G14]UDY22240.1 TetR/AcrR family transcriptional regulator [Nocardioides sp. Kera G14]